MNSLCPKCSRLLPAEARFCTRCGAAVPLQAAQPTGKQRRDAEDASRRLEELRLRKAKAEAEAAELRARQARQWRPPGRKKKDSCAGTGCGCLLIILLVWIVFVCLGESTRSPSTPPVPTRAPFVPAPRSFP